MQLAHLLPHLDAEIDRLQKARDLLAFIPASYDFSSVSPASQPPLEDHPSLRMTQANGTSSAVQLEEEKTPVSTAIQKPATPTARIIPSRERRTKVRGSEVRQDRRRRMIVADTALRGSVPTGPVVVSAEDVRKSQALKTAQATRAAEAKTAGVDPMLSFGWRGEASDVRNMDTLLQRLIHLGEEKVDQKELSQFSPLDQRKSFEALHTPLIAKAH